MIKPTSSNQTSHTAAQSAPMTNVPQNSEQLIDGQIRVLFDNLSANPRHMASLGHENPELAEAVKNKDFGRFS